MKKIIKSRTAACILICTFLWCMSTDLKAQVTIGSDLEPNKGALLDLKERNPDNLAVDNSTTNKGLGMPRVKLTSLNSISDIKGAEGKEKEHTGLCVYNVNTNASLISVPDCMFGTGNCGDLLSLYNKRYTKIYLPLIIFLVISEKSFSGCLPPLFPIY